MNAFPKLTSRDHRRRARPGRARQRPTGLPLLPKQQGHCFITVCMVGWILVRC